MLIRNASLEDLTSIVEIYNSSIPGRLATADLNPISVESRREWYDKHSPQSRPIWVVESGAGEIMGWLSFQHFYYDRPAYHATADISIYIAPIYQGQGLGPKLITEALKRSPELGIKVLLGFICAHNQPSLKLFTKMGFEQWGYLPKIADLDGVERDVAIFGRSV